MITATMNIFNISQTTGGSSGTTSGSVLRVDVLDVGQGDAILLRTSDGKVALIDGGPSKESMLDALREPAGD